jgi:hypothetical protein
MHQPALLDVSGVSPIGADAGQFNYLDLYYYSHSIVPGGFDVMS